MASIDLSLQPLSGRDELAVLVVSPASQAGFTAPRPAALLELHAAWRRRFVLHHSRQEGALPAAVLEDYSEQLIRGLQQWFEHERWRPLHRALRLQPGLPLRLRLAPELRALEELPWESLPLDRPLWRLPPLDPAQPVAKVRSRRARLLVVVGHEQELDLEPEVEALQDLARRGRYPLRLLRGEAANPRALQAVLAEEPGWDALIFLGHGEASADQGGRLQLGDGSWVSGASLELPLRRAVDRGLTLVLLHCCLGIDLAHRCLASGVAWVQVFRERVPDGAAALACRRLLHELQAGRPLALAQQRAALALEQPPWSGCRGLLSVYGHPDAPPFRWPRPREGLRRRELLLAGGAAGLAYGLGQRVGWHVASNEAVTRWRLATTYARDAFKPLVVGEVWRRLIRELADVTDQSFVLLGPDEFSKPGGLDVSQLDSLDILKQVNEGSGYQCAYVDIYYDQRLRPLFFAKAIPFGLSPREQSAWLAYEREGDGRPFRETVYARLQGGDLRLQQLRSFPISLTNGQMGGWFKKELSRLEDLRGLRMRIPGIGAEVLNAFGVKTDYSLNDGKVIAADEIRARLSGGLLDAAEWIGPGDDVALGLQKAKAPFYYAPGWWEPSTTNELMVNRQRFQGLSPAHQKALETVCRSIYQWCQTEYDRRNMKALRELRRNPEVQLRRFPPALMQAFEAESQRLLQEYARQDPSGFGYVYDEWRRFRQSIRDTIAVTQYQPPSPCG